MIVNLLIIEFEISFINFVIDQSSIGISWLSMANLALLDLESFEYRYSNGMKRRLTTGTSQIISKDYYQIKYKFTLV